MSHTYIFKFQANLKAELSTQEITSIKYLFGKDQKKPGLFPKHSFFSDSGEVFPLKLAYENFPKDAYAIDFQSEQDNSNKIIKYTVNLCIPGLTLEEIYEYFLPMLTWLVTHSISTGKVGYFALTAEEEFEPMELFIYKNAIYLGNEDSAHSFTSGEKVSFNELS